MSEQQESEIYENEEDQDFGEDGQLTGGSEALRMCEEEEMSCADMISYLGSGSDDPEQRRQYLEYMSLVKEIACQNQTIDDLKNQIAELNAKPCKNRCEMQEIQRLRSCMQCENAKLQCLVRKAMELQNFGSKRRWPDVPIATTVDEDNMVPYIGQIPPHAGYSQPNFKTERYESSEIEKSMSSQADRRPRRSSSSKKLMKEIAGLICRMQKEHQQLTSGKTQRATSRKQRPQGRTYHESSSPCQPPQKPKQPVNPEMLKKLKQRIFCMQDAICKLKEDVSRRERELSERECEARKQKMSQGVDPVLVCETRRDTKCDQMDKLKESYLYLLSEYSKKENKLKDLEKRLKGFCGGCVGAGGGVVRAGKGDEQNADQSELELLRIRVNDLKEEQIEFKCIMKEQSQQLEDYRSKYLVAQQKVEEQCVLLEKMNMNNKRIEKQINAEVKEIRAKFQEKLNELLHFPKLLENEQVKLAHACKDKEELQSKLMLVCKELQSLKSQLDALKDTPDCSQQLAKCQNELTAAQKKVEQLESQRDMFCEKLKTTREDLDTLRSESVKIIVRTKERAEILKQQQQEQISRLEKELAQCRASACLSVKDREAVIREMQGQLNTLSYSFDSAQKQIKTLRNHIAYVSNENSFPVKC